MSNWKCKYCGETFNSMFDLAIHEEREEKGKEEDWKFNP